MKAIGKSKNLIRYLPALAAAFFAAGISAAPVENVNNGPSPDSYTDFENNFYVLPESFGDKDDRVLVTDSSSLPWSAIGRLDIGYELPCTGAMAGSRIMATAGHCVIGGTKIPVPELDGEIIIPDKQITISTGHINGHGNAETGVTMFFRPNSYYSKTARHDYAYALLDKPVGNLTGWFELAAAPFDNIEELERQKTPLYQAGYSGDSPDEMTANIGCHIIETEQYAFYHDCDTLPGDSGSPVLRQYNGRYYIAGVNHSTTTLPDEDILASYAVPAAAMRDALDNFKKYIQRLQHQPEQNMPPPETRQKYNYTVSNNK